MTTNEKINYLNEYVLYLESKGKEELSDSNLKDLEVFKEIIEDYKFNKSKKPFAKVEQLENKNQFVIETNEGVYFQSYDSVCAKVSSEGLTLGYCWDYSHTTLKHLYIFLDNYCYNIYKEIRGSKNKRAMLQKMINEGLINYDEEMR